MTPGMTLDELARAIKTQADRLFPKRTDDSMWLKLISEVGEFADERGPAEMADILIMLLDYAARKEWAMEIAIMMKMSINEKREWINVDGVYKHVSR